MGPLRSPHNVLLSALPLCSLVWAVQYDVKVGAGGQLKFDPKTLNAQVDDQTTSHFFAKKPLGSSTNVYRTVSTSGARLLLRIRCYFGPGFWVYCGRTNNDHCQSGMVHAVNAPAEGPNTFANFKSLATKAQKPSQTPADGLPVGGLRKLHVDVGFDGDLVFNPINVGELPRTIVEFSFDPANHSIVQSSFDAPCQSLDAGFSAPFVPTQQTPSGVTFEVEIQDTKPIWFYCAQTAKTHCQAGMVGNINAATTGDETFAAFQALAAKSPALNIQPHQPNVGILTVNGTPIYDIGSAVFDSAKTGWDPSIVTGVPKPGYTYPPYMVSMAGSAVPENYGWTDGISSNATEYLQIMQFSDNLLVDILYAGYQRLREGDWKGLYPESITRTIGSILAQALVQRSTYIESLQHYNKPTIDGCQFDLHSDDLEDWLQNSLTLMNLSIGSMIDIVTQIAEADHWMIAALATAIGAKARMSAVINMMQNHMTASAPREVLIPVELAIGYVHGKYNVSDTCGSGVDALEGVDYPALGITARETETGTDRLTSITVSLPSVSGSKYLAWIGLWGGVKYSDVEADGQSTVPENLSGHVWIVMTSAKGLKAKDFSSLALTDMEIVWVTDPWAHS
ncbi:extracellular serine-rich protein [Seiridium cupressi]